MSDILRIQSVTKKFGSLAAVNEVSLNIEPGMIYALIGPNGSGKTTLVNCVVGLLKPDSGKITIKDVDVQEKSLVAKHLFSYISDNPAIYPYLTGFEFLNLNANLKGLSSIEAREKIKELSQLFPISDILETKTESYSRGNLEKTAYLAALLGDPLLLVIDEPIVGLDVVSVKILGESLKKFTAKGGAVLFSTHTLSFAKKYADKIGVIREGRLIKESLVTSKTNIDEIYLRTTS